MAGDENEERGFTIVDRRGRDGEEEEAAAPPETPRPADAAADDDRRPLPKADFTSLVLGLAQSALLHLGAVADPDSGEPLPANLPIAKHTIDTLEVLEEKTQGNLSDEEQQLLRNLLLDLRMRFVEASR